MTFIAYSDNTTYMKTREPLHNSWSADTGHCVSFIQSRVTSTQGDVGVLATLEIIVVITSSAT